MIVDSHAHYTHARFGGSFRYLTVEEGAYALAEGDVEELLAKLERAGITASVEPGISLESNRRLLEFCAAHPGRVFPAVGVHPTRCFREAWRDRRKVAALARTPGVVAIGETGLDYHYERKDQHRFVQTMWFWYQLRLSRKLALPQILHIRDAHADALRILRRHPARKQGGVVHCFNGDWDTAKEYLDLGYHIGIGGSILKPEDQAGALWEAVRRIPLERILLETDAPYILPYCKDVLPSKQLRRAANSSMILPKVAEKIAALKEVTPAEVERATTENTIRLFCLPEELERALCEAWK